MHRVRTGVLSLAMLGMLAAPASPQDCTWSLRQLTSSGAHAEFPTISSDGRRASIARASAIELIDVATGAAQPLAVGWWPTISADGNTIAFVDSNNNLAIVRPSGDGGAMSWNVGPIYAGVAISADGSSIAFPSSAPDGWSVHVFLLDTGTGAVRQLAAVPDGYAGFLTMSANGRKVAWVDGLWTIKLYDLDTESVTTLAQGWAPSLNRAALRRGPVGE